MNLEITLVRHGNTDANNERWLQGHVDTELNKNGLRQAESCGKRLAQASYDHVYCSDLTRCEQTAAAIMTYHPHASIEYSPSLRERDFGTLVRQHVSYLTSESSQQGISIDQLITNHEGESLQIFRERVIHAFESIVQDAIQKQYKSVLIVTHGGPLKQLTSYWTHQAGLKAKGTLRIALVAQGNTAITRIDWTNKCILEFNCTQHLKHQAGSSSPPPAV
ncbi:histidine phosphatase superfamily [Gilbertella persicaria]|uniref:histidine phosphatase superfamily n=1 Tax=Gilbertella persicaria TaxID=101096 RepID=UPI00221E496D|nr:histidine phosphatase superfamily [Gilbertella persicaria]KAI8094868.1 histidine phosphatase superfamily [Gilbertella persicaria]